MSERILVVEDERYTREAIVNGLATRVKNVRIDKAGTIEDALTLVEAAAREEAPFTIAILDLKLPRRLGEIPEVDETICHTLIVQCRGVLVIHITSYGNDRWVLNHMEKYHQGDPGAPVAFLRKEGAEWPDELVQLVRRHIAACRFDESFDRACGRLHDIHSMGARTGFPAARSSTDAMLELIQVVQEHWPHLDQRRKGLAQSRFEVTEGEGRGVPPIVRSLL